MPIARSLALFLLAVGMTAVPARSLAADCQPQDRSADQIFAHPYGEPTAPCPVEPKATPGSLESEHENILADDRGPRRLHTIGISGVEAGATIAVLGGLLSLVSAFMDNDSNGKEGKAKEGLKWTGIGAASLGGAVAVAGIVLIGIDYIAAPAPTPDRKGAQLVLAFRF
jgi:hypothetical protein